MVSECCDLLVEILDIITAICLAQFIDDQLHFMGHSADIPVVVAMTTSGAI